LNNLGTAIQEQGKLDEAIKYYRDAVAARPNYAEALSNLANALRLKDQPTEAIETLKRAAAIRPDIPEIHYNLGLALQSNRQFDEAAGAYRQALALRPQYPDAFNNLGNVLEETGQFEEAIGIYREVLKLRPDLPEAHNNLATALKQTGQLDEATAEYRQAIMLRPNFVEAHSNLGNALGEAGLLDEAESTFQKALAIQPDYHEAAWNLGLLRLLQGDFERGWKAYEARNHLAMRLTPSEETKRVFRESLWQGEELHGRRILLLGEQGLGDTLQFIRYATLVASRGGRVLLYCQPRLRKLLTGQIGIEQVVPIGEELPAFDFCCPLMSLPYVFGTREGTIPANVPYLRADPALVDVWRKRVEAANEDMETRRRGCAHASTNLLAASPRLRVSASSPLRVGLVWAGNPTYRNDRNRSIPLAALSPLESVPGVRFFSLQKGEASKQAQNPPAGMETIDWTSELNDLSDTAALVQNLDLVISVDTAVAHLAGALAKPVWLLLPLTPDWRWMLGRSDTPWYPTMRLFRQPRRGDWQTPIDQIAAEVGRLRSQRPWSSK
jgi:Flp pilus assembly protein TadD